MNVVRTRVIAWSIAAPALALAGSACGSSTSDCTCVVDSGGERRTLACGETSCVGGTLLACGDQNRVVTRGSCTPGSGSGENGNGDDSGSTAPPDTSCSDLNAFCTTACNSPASTAADCLSTASAGAPQACQAWQATNGVLCKP